MKKFGDNVYLSESEAIYVEKLVSKIKEIKYDELFFYTSYPFFIQNNKKNNMKALFICKKGIFIFSKSESEFKMFSRQVLKMIIDSDLFDALNLKRDFLFKFYTNDDIDDLIDKLRATEEILKSSEIDVFNKVFQYAEGLNFNDNREIKNPSGLGSKIKEKINKINSFDETQFDSIYRNNSSNERIIGLAGTGKTILMCKKMAYLHFKNRDLKMVYLFFTKSLKQTVKNLFIKFYKDFDTNEEINFENVRFLHGWGSYDMEGFYSYICKEKGINPKSYNEVRRSGNPFESVCQSLLDDIGHEDIGIYDYIFVDEAQDFGQYFFRLVLKALNSVGKLIYAYDELQMLREQKDSLPTKKQLFGKKSQYCIDTSLSKSYRNPTRLLIIAHALGLGIYNYEGGKQDIINIGLVKDFDVWNNIGYSLTRDSDRIGYDKDVILERSDLDDMESGFEEFMSFNSKEEQYNHLIEEITRLILEEDVFSEDILIIDLDTINFKENFIDIRKKIFEKYGDDNNKYPFNMNPIYKDNAIDFFKKGEVCYTSIFRAKGNEANIVFVINSDKMNFFSTRSRQMLFTGMTRARVKAYVFGKDIENFIVEKEKVIENDYKLVFHYPSKSEFIKKGQLLEKEVKLVDSYENAAQSLKGLKDLDSEMKLRILIDQLGLESKEQLMELLKNEKTN